VRRELASVLERSCDVSLSSRRGTSIGGSPSRGGLRRGSTLIG
jgi:hypothetical protein